jgi:hypothetical protein
MEASGPTWTINEVRYTTLADVGQVLRSVCAVDASVPVILHNEPDVPLGHVIDVYDLSRVIGFEKVQFAVSR